MVGAWEWESIDGEEEVEDNHNGHDDLELVCQDPIEDYNLYDLVVGEDPDYLEYDSHYDLEQFEIEEIDLSLSVTVHFETNMI